MIYECGDFSKVENIGVICRGASIRKIKKCADKFNDCFLVGQHENALNHTGKYLLLHTKIIKKYPLDTEIA